MAINLSNILKQAQNQSRIKQPNVLSTQQGAISPTFSQNTGNVARTSSPISATLPSNASVGDATRFLYDTRLQNVFNDYQQQVATLEQAEQKQLQDAYFIRELSKKYLGEYASNTGLGDVSGNLLDIYGAYQQNVTSIQQQSEQLKLGLQQAYDQQSQAAFQGAIEAQLQAEQMQLDENARNTLFNITQGNLNGLEWDDYLQRQLNTGEISQQSYQVLFTQIYQAKLSEVKANLDRNFFGFKTDIQGNRVMMTKEEYIDANKGWLNASDLQNLKDLAMIQQTQEGKLTIQTVDKFDWYNSFGLGGNGYGFTITDESGNFLSFQTHPKDVDNDSQAKIQVSSEDLTDAFEEKYPSAPLISGQTTFEYKGNYYIYLENALEGGSWYRAINYTATANLYKKMTEESVENLSNQWKIKESNQMILTTKYFSYDKNTSTLTLTDDTKTQLRHATSAEFEFDGRTLTSPNALPPDLQKIRNEFSRIHGGGLSTDGVTPVKGWASIKNSMIFFEGFFYFINSKGEVRKFVRK